jgi:hypothetical protein
MRLAAISTAMDDTLRTAATAQRASGGSAGLESEGFAPAGRACRRHRRDCYDAVVTHRRHIRYTDIDAHEEAKRHERP